MRTKTVLTAAAGMLCAASVMAVTSVNVVGYVNMSLQAGNNLIGNPLSNAGGNTLSAVMPTVPDGTTFTPWDEVGQAFAAPATYLGGWDTDYPMPVGGGGFLFLDSATTVTFVGDVMQGNLSSPIVGNNQIRSSLVPQTGLLSTDLGFPGLDGDTCTFWNSTSVPQGYGAPATFLGGWDTEPPITFIGQAFFINRDPSMIPPGGTFWTRTFNVQ
jgi:hypothetical protein